MILFISTISNNEKKIRRLRRRLVKIVINARTFRAIFIKITIKELNIFVFIDIYNYYINKINNIN